MGLPVVPKRAYAWNQLDDFAGPVRDGARVIFFHGTAKTYLFNGWNTVTTSWWGGLQDGALGYTTNEGWVWNEIAGAFELFAEHDPDATDRPGPRHTAGFCQIKIDGVWWLYCIGGDVQNGGTPDVWRTRDPEQGWELVRDDAPWDNRFLHMVGTLNGAIYVMGGQTDLEGSARNDVWRSTNGGVSWTQLDDAPWLPRGMVYDLVEHRGYLWLVGGGTYAASRNYYNDVWRFDGETWVEVLGNGHSQWPGREYHSVVVFGGRIVVSGGWRDANRNDVHSSPDGRTWTQMDESPWAAEHAAGLAATPKGLLHATGNAMNLEVHRLELAA